MAVPHSDSSRRNAAASVVSTALFASSSLIDTGERPAAEEAEATLPAPDAALGTAGWMADNGARPALSAVARFCHICQPATAAMAQQAASTAPAAQPSQRAVTRRP